MAEQEEVNLNSVAYRRYLKLVQVKKCEATRNQSKRTAADQALSSDVTLRHDKKFSVSFPPVRKLARQYDEMLSKRRYSIPLREYKSCEDISPCVSFHKHKQVFEHDKMLRTNQSLNNRVSELFPPSSNSKKSSRRNQKTFNNPRLYHPLRRSWSEPRLVGRPHRLAGYSDLNVSLSRLDIGIGDERSGYPNLSATNDDVWNESQYLSDVRSCSVSPASLSPSCHSMEEIQLSSKFMPIHYFNKQRCRSISSDSAVVMDDFHSCPSTSPSMIMSPSTSPKACTDVGKQQHELPRETLLGLAQWGPAGRRGDRRGRIALNEIEKNIDFGIVKGSDMCVGNKADDQDIILRRTPGRSALRTPSVIISDDTGATYVALTSQGRRPSQGHLSNNLLASFLGAPLDYTICPRKVSDCSTCSSVSTVDMSAMLTYETLHVSRIGTKEIPTALRVVV